MKIIPVKGTRDFYPDEMRLRNWIIDAWRRVSLRNGFEEYDSPILEYLDLFTIKSGDEIVSQLFNFTDRGGRDLAIRPEITPSLARMVNARINSLRRPAKWFSVPRLCRAENPQKGRLREFFQWNVDVIGSDSILADAECILVCVDFLREVGLTPDDVCVRVGSRPLTTASLIAAGTPAESIEKVLPVLDKREKVSDEEFARLAAEAGLSEEQTAAARQLQDAADIDEVAALLDGADGAASSISDLREMMDRLTQMGVADYCRLDMRIIRGLAYYTGIVYEVFDRGESLRAIAGGGRYDNLLEILGGPTVGAVGFGMGDVVLGILLQEKGKLPETLKAKRIDYYVIEGGETISASLLATVGALRRMGYSAEFSYQKRSVNRQFKEASRCGADAIIVVRDKKVEIKDRSGEQREMTAADFLAECETAAAPPARPG
ncbi:MAG: histidine--tRNA ligase [Planctomycetes bacterium]|nr:histidine--tRNA ligase [Planctomycetota bacterium]